MSEEPEVSPFLLVSFCAMLLLALYVFLQVQGCAVGSQYTRTESTVTIVGAPAPVGFGPRSL